MLCPAPSCLRRNASMQNTYIHCQSPFALTFKYSASFLFYFYFHSECFQYGCWLYEYVSGCSPSKNQPEGQWTGVKKDLGLVLSFPTSQLNDLEQITQICFSQLWFPSWLIKWECSSLLHGTTVTIKWDEVYKLPELQTRKDLIYPWHSY